MWGVLHKTRKIYRLFQTQHSFSVTSFTLGFRLFFNLLQINFLCFPLFILLEIEVWQHPRQGVSFACEPELRWGAYRL
jgi:hypothetical protein